MLSGLNTYPRSRGMASSRIAPPFQVNAGGCKLLLNSCSERLGVAAAVAVVGVAKAEQIEAVVRE
jgi:hypothetical protein